MEHAHDDCVWHTYIRVTGGDRHREIMRKSATFRFDPELLERARRCAEAENRSLTNFIETALRRIVDSGKTTVRAEEALDPVTSTQGS